MQKIVVVTGVAGNAGFIGSALLRLLGDLIGHAAGLERTGAWYHVAQGKT